MELAIVGLRRTAFESNTKRILEEMCLENDCNQRSTKRESSTTTQVEGEETYIDAARCRPQAMAQAKISSRSHESGAFGGSARPTDKAMTTMRIVKAQS